MLGETVIETNDTCPNLKCESKEKRKAMLGGEAILQTCNSCGTTWMRGNSDSPYRIQWMVNLVWNEAQRKWEWKLSDRSDW